MLPPKLPHAALLYLAPCLCGLVAPASPAWATPGSIRAALQQDGAEGEPAVSQAPQVQSAVEAEADTEAPVPAALDLEEVAAQESSFRTTEYGLPDLKLLLRAGLAPPAGLTALRAQERAALQKSAIKDLSARLATSERTAWIAALQAVLEGAPGGSALWLAAARVVGELGLYELDHTLTRGLAADASARMQLASQRSLALLYGVAPPVSGEGELVRPFEPSAGTGHLLSLLREKEVEWLAQRFDLLARERAMAVAALNDADSRVRAEAARVLAKVVEKGEASELNATLLPGLATEVDPLAFHTRLQALLATTAGETADGERVRSLRSELVQLAGAAPSDRLLSISRALARLPWTLGSDQREHGLSSGIHHLINLLGRLAADPFSDGDAILGTVEALRSLVDKAGNDSKIIAQLERGPLTALVRNPNRSESERIAAAGVLGQLARASDLDWILNVLLRADTSASLRYALLGTAAALADKLTPGSPEGRALVLNLFSNASAPDVDLRRRALALLNGDAMGPHLEGEWDELFRILARETEPKLRSEALSLLQRHGNPRVLVALLQLDSFDELVRGDPGRVVELAGTIRNLAAGGSEELMGGARRLIAVQDNTTRRARLAQALQLAAGLNETSASRLSALDHREVIDWCLELSDAGEDLVALLGIDFVHRLMGLHLGAAAFVDSAEIAAARRASIRARLLSALATGGELQRVDEALAEYEKALVLLAELPEQQAFAARVRRDRARLALRNGNRVRSLADYRSLLARPNDGLLELVDLRNAADLLGGRSDAPRQTGAVGEAAERARLFAVEAFGILHNLVNRPEWRREQPAVRLQDLVGLGNQALASEDPRALRLAQAVFAGLPKVVPSEEVAATETEAPGAVSAAADALPLWDGLERQADGLERLRNVSDSLSAALPRVKEASPSPASLTGGDLSQAGESNRTKLDSVDDSGSD